MMLLLVFAFGAITQAIGVHLVLGAFVAAILIGRFRRIDPTAIAGVRQVGMGFFVPIFFAYTGIKVDLTTLRGSAITFTILAVLVACFTKIVGGSLGARAGGLPKWEALGVGVGLNARGAMELVIAAIGLSIGLRGNIRHDHPDRSAHHGHDGTIAQVLREPGWVRRGRGGGSIGSPNARGIRSKQTDLERGAGLTAIATTPAWRIVIEPAPDA
jgi:Kef-type K+ transport system membrane component KefB